ncbi:MAG: carbon monoxide dehydrogenase subunit G [Hyphomicrobiaceae bacterium]|nr:carbon monoxide dehydrogenase subunit G [Hyphomicrobiaceae bacterium]
MILEGEWLIPIDRRTVWRALNDPEMLRVCIPGCQSLEKHSDTEFASSIKAAVGPVNATFHAKIGLTDIDPDRGYTIVGEGKGGAAGFARGKAKVDLEDDGEGTRLSYRAEVNIGGKLAQVGSRLIQGTARKLSEQFFRCLTEELSAGSGKPTPEQPAATAAAPSSTNASLVWVVAAILAVAAIGWWFAG